MSIKTLTNPSLGVIAEAWHHIDTDIDGCRETMRTFDGWCDYLSGNHLHYFPIFIMDGTRAEAVIWFTDYDAEVRTCQVHFLTAKDIRNPLGVARAAWETLVGIMRNGDIDVLFGFLPAGNERARKCARLFGMETFAESSKLVYMAMTA